MTRLCLRCEREERKPHANARYCSPCSEYLKRKPISLLSHEQKEYALRSVGKRKTHEMAQDLGVSLSQVRRFFRDQQVNTRIPKYNRKLKREVIAHYEKQGTKGIAEAFPDIGWRHIIDRTTHKARQRRWTPREIVAVTKMAGLVPKALQARVLNRPNAHSGSITSFWHKNIPVNGSLLHGMRYHAARHILRPGFPIVRVAYSRSERCVYTSIVLWCDMVDCLRPDMPAFIREGIAAMRQFQCWLYGSEDPRQQILDIVSFGYAAKGMRRSL